MAHNTNPLDPIRFAADWALNFADRVRAERVVGRLDVRGAQDELAAFDFAQPRPPEQVLAAVADLLQRGLVHVTHPAYFGLFNPSVFPEGVAAALLTAAFNPQLATVQHAPAAFAIEQHVLGFFARALGFDPERVSHHFTSGGQEANTEALLIALCHHFPAVREHGVRALDGDPVLYVSAEAHHSFEKAAHAAGLGRAAVRRVAVDDHLRLDIAALEAALAHDRGRGALPFFVVATAGATSSGAIDPLQPMAEFAQREALWLHTDAAWGGAAVLSPRHGHHLAGIERSDSVTWDAHKWLQAPMGTGMLFTRHASAPRAAFATRSPYMPARQGGFDDPYDSSLPWSRRAAGIAPFVSLAVRGNDGLAAMVERMFELGDLLRELLVGAGFTIENHTPLPLVCFSHPDIERGATSASAVAARLQDRGRCWISPTRLANGRTVLRAAITSHRTEQRDLERLLSELTLALKPVAEQPSQHPPNPPQCGEARLFPGR